MKVYLIGAGPGDPGLLTIKGMRILQQADVVVYDYLASDLLLSYVKEDAEIIYAGKKAGDHTLPQAEINRLIVKKALEGKMVARLKGGDPYIFGRGAEEAEELLEAGVDFEVVPGVTSAIAGPAYAGIPLTHRSYASSVSFITGHENPDKAESSHNWDALAKSTSTLVFFMGMKNLPNIAVNLIKAGMPKDTPAALVHWGTTAHHRSVAATIETLPQVALDKNFTNPSLIVVGGVVALHDTLNWFEKKPLLGQGVVVTRAREQASGLANQLTELGADVVQFPTIKIVPLEDYSPVDAAIKQIKDYNWLIFTSVNGVKYFWKRLTQLKLDARVLAGVQIAAIGPATAEVLQEKGIIPDFIPELYVAESAVDGLLALGVTGKRVLLPRAQEAREVLPESLRKAGAQVDVLPIYKTIPEESKKDTVVERLQNGSLHCLTFGSSSTVDNFFTLIDPSLVKHSKVALACIGPVTAQTLKEKYGLESTIMPKAFTIPSLVTAITEKLGKK